MPHMQDDFPLLLSTLYDQAVRLYPDQEIVSVDAMPHLSRSSGTSSDPTDQTARLARYL